MTGACRGRWPPPGCPGTGTGWPGVILVAAMAALGISGGWQIMPQATRELRGERERLVAAA